MKYDKPWESQIVSALLRKNDLKPTEQDDIILSDITNLGVADGVKNTYNMGSTVLFREFAGNYNGSLSIKYQTSHLETLFAEIIIPTIYAYNPHTLHEIAAIFIEQYGLPYSVAWFNDGPFDARTMPTHVTLTTKATAFCAASQLTIRIERSKSDVAELFANTTLTALTIPFDPNMRSTPIATYGVDFTPFYDDQKALFSSAVVSATLYRGDTSAYDDPQGRLELFEFIESRIGDDVVMVNTDPTGDSIDKINLMEFYVRYNGVTANAKYGNVSANTQYDRVLILESAAPTNLTNYDGPLFIHYNNA